MIALVVNQETEQFLRVLTRTLESALTAARADADVLLNRADVPVPLLRQIASNLRLVAPQLEHLANRADELVADWERSNLF